MSDLLGRASRWLQARRKSSLARTVEYRRGGDVLTVSAAVGSTTFELTDDQGVRSQVASRDYLIEDSELNGVDPKPGDVVFDKDEDGNPIAYEVNNMDSEACWRWSDRNRITRRVHTKQVKA